MKYFFHFIIQSTKLRNLLSSSIQKNKNCEIVSPNHKLIWKKSISFRRQCSWAYVRSKSPMDVHHFVMFPLTLQQDKVRLSCNLERDQISPACASFCHIPNYYAAKTGPTLSQSWTWSNFSCMYTLSSFHSLCGKTGPN